MTFFSIVKSEKFQDFGDSGQDGHAFNLTPRTLCVGSSDIIEKRTGAEGPPPEGQGPPEGWAPRTRPCL